MTIDWLWIVLVPALALVIGAVIGKRWSREDHAVFGCKYKDEIEDLKLLLYKIGEAEAATVSQKQLVELLQEWLKKKEGEDG